LIRRRPSLPPRFEFASDLQKNALHADICLQKQKTAKKPALSVRDLEERIKKGLIQKEKIAVKIKTIETRLMIAKTQEMKVDCEKMRHELSIKELQEGNVQ